MKKLPSMDADHTPLLIYAEKAGLFTGFLVSFVLPSLSGSPKIIFLIGLVLWTVSVIISDGLDMMELYSPTSVMISVIVPFAIELYTAYLLGPDSIPGMITAAVLSIVSVYAATIEAQRLESPVMIMKRIGLDL